MKFLCYGFTFLVMVTLACFAQSQHGCSIFGNLKYPKDFTHFDYVNANAPKQGKANLGALGTFDSLNPFILKGTAAAGVPSYCVATLLASAGDEISSAYGYVAKSVKVAADYTSVIFELNPSARFDDGEPITADDVIFTFNLLMKEGLPSYKEYYRNIEKVEALSKHQVVFHCPKNKSREIGLILGQLPVLSKKYFSTHPFNKSSLKTFPCSGPYRIKEIKAGQRIVYERIKNWWGENVASQKGCHNFDEIVIDYYRETTALFEAFKSGNIDIRVENSARLLKTGYNFDAFKDGRVKYTDIHHKMCTGTFGFFFNTRKSFFQDVKVRKAMAYLFDFDWASKNLFFSQYQRNLSYFPNAPFAADGIPKGREKDILMPFQDQLPQTIFHEPFSLPSFNNAQDQRKNLETVLGFFEEAGWTLKDQKLVSKATGKVFEFELIIPDKGLEKVALHLQSCLQKAGITMHIRLLDVSTYQERMDGFDFDMIIGVIGQSLTPGNEQLSYWGSESSKLKGSKNWSGIQNPVVDELIKALINAQTYDELTHYMRALDRVLLWNFYMIPAWHNHSMPVFYWDSLKFKEHPVYEPWGYSHWWFEKNKSSVADLEKTSSTWMEWFIKKWQAFLAFFGFEK